MNTKDQEPSDQQSSNQQPTDQQMSNQDDAQNSCSSDELELEENPDVTADSYEGVVDIIDVEDAGDGIPDVVEIDEEYSISVSADDMDTGGYAQGDVIESVILLTEPGEDLSEGEYSDYEVTDENNLLSEEDEEMQ